MDWALFGKFNKSINFIRMQNRENLFKLEFSNFVGN